MARSTNKIIQNLLVSTMMIIAILTQVLFLTSATGYYTIFLPAGVAAGFYVSFGKKVVPGLAISTFIGILLFSFLFTDKTLTDALLYTLPILSINAFASYLMNLFLSLFKCKTPDTIIKATYFFISIVITTFIITLAPAIQYTVQNDSSFIYELGMVYQPVFIGLSILSTTIILSNHYDDLLNKKIIEKYKDLIFIIVFSGISYIIFSNVYVHVDFGSYGPVFIILFMINAFAFNYRMLLFNSFIYIFLYNTTYLRLASDIDALRISALLNMYLFILLVITIFTKVLVREIQEKNKELTETKKKFASMIDSTRNLLSVKDTLAYENEDYHESFIKSIFDIAMKIFPEITNGACGLVDDKKLITLNTKGYDLEFFQSLNFPASKFRQDVYTPILNSNFDKVFGNAFGQKYSTLKDKLPDIKQSLIILLKLSNNTKGVIIFDILQDSKEKFTESDISNIAAFQKMINSFYEMNELSLKNSSLKDDIVLSLIRTLELYDQYTGGHSEDVASLGKLIAEKMKLSDNDIYDIYWAGIVHDIGKIGISSEIINKPSKLTLAEYKQVQQHPIFGFDILNRSSDLKTIAKLVKHHHEWYNGSGYPSGLKSNDIPLGSQILQVADSVSSMATSRSYQKDKSFDEIISELELYKGTQFNPAICEHMIELIKSGVVEKQFKNSKVSSN